MNTESEIQDDLSDQQGMKRKSSDIEMEQEDSVVVQQEDEYEGQGETVETANDKTITNRQKVWKQPMQKRPRRYHPMRGRPWENSMETCRFFERGNCRNGDFCRFRHNRERPKVCKEYAKGNHCPFGTYCKFMHANFPCRFMRIGGKCPESDNCRFSHDPLSEELKRFFKTPMEDPDRNLPRYGPKREGRSPGVNDPLKLFVGGFDESMTDEKLRGIFPDAVDVHISVKVSKREGHYGFVWFSDEAKCKAALEKYQNNAPFIVRQGMMGKLVKEMYDKTILFVRNYDKDTDFTQLCPEVVTVEATTVAEDTQGMLLKFTSEEHGEKNLRKLKGSRASDGRPLLVSFLKVLKPEGDQNTTQESGERDKEDTKESEEK